MNKGKFTQKRTNVCLNYSKFQKGFINKQSQIEIYLKHVNEQFMSSTFVMMKNNLIYGVLNTNSFNNGHFNFFPTGIRCANLNSKTIV